ncbi:MAG: M56 family metallopeptidase [Ktedonobacteraceae bacterium]|nr:M56 family metallopeptidase [Ktedonobacteraceae bacterium]
MHTVLTLASFLLSICGCSLILTRLSSPIDWSKRRSMQMLLLAAPLISLGFSAGELCLQMAPTWDTFLDLTFFLVMAGSVVAALGLNLMRLTLLTRFLARQRGVPDTVLQTSVDLLARQRGVTSPRLLVCQANQPLALTYGLFRPTILLSTWMRDRLDRRELEAVLAHELEHVARHDFLIIWLATILRDAFCYLPTSRKAYERLHREKELACDDVVVRTTRRPLALASALTKIWLHAVEEPQPAPQLSLSMAQPAQSLAGAGESLKERIERLLVSGDSPSPDVPPPFSASPLSIIASVISMPLVPLLLHAVSITLLILLMRCDLSHLLIL